MRIISTLFLVVVFAVTSAQSKQESLKVFLDCTNYGDDCYFDYVRQEMNRITFVRDRTDADVHILMKSNWNSVGIQISTLFVIGRKNFEGMKDTFNYSIPLTNTDDIRRKLLVKNVKIALMPFIAKTNLANDIELNLKKENVDTTQEIKPKHEKDPYDFWVFQFGASGSYSGNKIYSDASGNGYFAADRETIHSKTNLYITANEQFSKYIDDVGDAHKYEYQEFTVGADYVKKLNEHYAVGGGTAFNNSIYSNLKTQVTIGPKMEYSIFPYKEFNNKRWVFAYGIDARNNQYYDTTLYLKTHEFFFAQNASSIFSFTQTWGSVNLGVFWRNLLNDWQKNSLSFNGAVSWKIAKGLKIAFWGNYNFVRNQINIRKGDATLDQLLAKNREILSSYNFSVGIGMSYRFGSKFNDAVNPCFKGLNYSINF